MATTKTSKPKTILTEARDLQAGDRVWRSGQVVGTIKSTGLRPGPRIAIELVPAWDATAVHNYGWEPTEKIRIVAR